MKKLLLIALLALSAGTLQAQDTCEELYDEVDYYGNRVWSPYVGYGSSEAIKDVEGHEYKGIYFLFITFQGQDSWDDPYIYGGWNENVYEQIEDAKDYSNTWGEWFHGWVRPNTKVGCDPN